MIILIEDIEEENRFKKSIENMYNVFRIIFDSNEFDRKKSHTRTKFLPMKRDLYTGYYPSEIRSYLQFLRYNLKNPSFKIEKKFKKDLIQVFFQNGLEIDEAYIRDLKLKNHSLVIREGFNNNKEDLKRTLSYARKFPGYETVLVISKEMAK